MHVASMYVYKVKRGYYKCQGYSEWSKLLKLMISIWKATIIASRLYPPTLSSEVSAVSELI